MNNTDYHYDLEGKNAALDAHVDTDGSISIKMSAVNRDAFFELVDVLNKVFDETGPLDGGD